MHGPDQASDRRIARQALWLGAISATQMLRSLLQVVIAVRILGPDGYGALAVIISTSAIAHGLLAIPGVHTITTYVSRSVAEGRPDLAANTIRLVLATSTCLSVLAYGVICALAVIAAGWLELEPIHINAMLLYGVAGIFLSTHAETLAILRLAERTVMGFLVTLLSALIHVGLLLAVWISNGGLLGVVSASIVGAATSGVLMFVAASFSARRAGAAKLFGSLAIKVPPEVWRFQIGTFGTATVTALAANIDTLVVAHFAGTAEAGLYRAARQLVEIARAPFAPIARSLQAEFSRQWFSLGGVGLRSAARRYTVLIAGTAAFGFGVLAVFREPVVALVYGDAFAAVASLLLIMLPGSLLVCCFLGLATLPHATGRVAPPLIAQLAALAASLVVLLAFVPTYQGTGAALAYLTASLTWCLCVTPSVVSILRRSDSRRVPPSHPRVG